MNHCTPKHPQIQQTSQTAQACTQPTPAQKKALQNKIRQLEQCYQLIQQQRMKGIPILNKKITIAAIDFHIWQERYIGILITPWFMNLVLLPADDENWNDLNPLTQQTHKFPSGHYTFTTTHETDIGTYQMCSLFSPMFEFADHQAAVQTAKVAIHELFNKDNMEHHDINTRHIANIWNGTENHPDKQKTIEQDKTLSEKLQTPISRRQMLRGKFFGEPKTK